MARLEGVEPPARGFEGRCSIQLSYRRVRDIVARDGRHSGLFVRTRRGGPIALTGLGV